MSAADMLDVAYSTLAERADDVDRLVAASGARQDGEPTARLTLDRELGLAAPDPGQVATNPTRDGELVPVREMSLHDLAGRLLTA